MQEFVLPASDGVGVQCYRWDVPNPRAIVQIAHGMGEHARRYDWVGQQLNDAGYGVYADDHRGHGVTGAHGLGDMGADGWNRTVADAFELNRHIAQEHPELPRVLLGHSMGAMLAQHYITRYGASIDAVALSGSGGFRPARVTRLPRLAARFEAWRLGPGRPSDVLQNMLFGGANKPFDGPGATGFEWLSRDAEQVQIYIDDPACGFVLAASSMVDLYVGAQQMQDERCLAKIPSQLPIYVFSGSDDPVHSGQRGLMTMVDAYRSAGLGEVSYKVYPQGRHELFNETNRDEVVADLVAWLGRALVAATIPERHAV